MNIYVPEDPNTKKYEVLWISRKQLGLLGFTEAQVAALSDEDMERIAYWLENLFKDHGFDDYVKHIVTLELTEKGMIEQEENPNEPTP